MEGGGGDEISCSDCEFYLFGGFDLNLGFLESIHKKISYFKDLRYKTNILNSNF